MAQHRELSSLAAGSSQTGIFLCSWHAWSGALGNYGNVGGTCGEMEGDEGGREGGGGGETHTLGSAREHRVERNHIVDGLIWRI